MKERIRQLALCAAERPDLLAHPAAMYDHLAHTTYAAFNEATFWRDLKRWRDTVRSRAETIDAEVHDIIDTSYNKATDVIREHMPKLKQVAEYLIEHETIEIDDLNTIWETPPDAADEPPHPSPQADPGPHPVAHAGAYS